MTSLSTLFDSDDCRPVMASTPGTGDASLKYSLDASIRNTEGSVRRCLWCRRELKASQLRWCSKLCRQTSWRARRLAVVEDLGGNPKRLAYADPPYPGLAHYYRNHPDYAGEVDHARLLEQLATYDGWALSTSAKALGDVLSLIPRGVDYHLCSWTKTHHHPKARGPANVWEPVIVVPGRRRLPGVPDAIVCAVARGGDSTLIGRKPLKVCNWLFQLLGATPRDSLDDLFPGSGNVSRCWSEFCRSATMMTPSAAMAGGAA